MRLLVILAVLCLAFSASAEDGVYFTRNVARTPDWETDHATMKVLSLNVPPQDSQFNLLVEGDDGFIYYEDDGSDDGVAVTLGREFIQPLIAFYHDGPVVHPEDSGAFPGHGNRDVYGTVSFDDGATWRNTNLSKSGFRSSFRLRDGTDYPGDTFRLFAASDGNKVCVAWASRYARGGNPLYSLVADEEGTPTDYQAAMATFLDVEQVTDLYVNDFFGVRGAQKSSDFADEDYPTVGEVPYAALWCARGTLEPCDELGAYDPAGEYHTIIWRQAERITSGVRDVHRIEVAAETGAGFVITWQEDPEGLRPGHGEGPGEGWSGAVAHHQTDIWYSWIDWNNFDYVNGSEDDVFDPILLEEFEEETIPAVGVPFAMPVRLTDNAMGSADQDGVYPPYLTDDFDGSGTILCASTVTMTIETPEGPVNDVTMCVTEDGRLLRGNVAATRCRVNLRGYDSIEDDVYADDSAWVVLAYEESKGLGEDEDYDTEDMIPKVDMGKNIWYHTFDMRHPEVVSQGMQMNMPAVYKAGQPENLGGMNYAGELISYDLDELVGTNLLTVEPDPIYDAAGLESTLYQNEIARRASMISQRYVDAGPSGMVAFVMWKQGIIRQGGPADVYGRRFVVADPDNFDPHIDNPFDYGNMVGENVEFAEASNPRYVKGLCIDIPTCMSGTSIEQCESSSLVDCAEDFPFNDLFDDIDMASSEIGVQRVFKWSLSGPDYGSDNYSTWGDPSYVTGPADGNNFNDHSWENPYDVAKGHRGYISGDFIMMLYCWSPNWLANTVGHDNYNLYIRRSFDGGMTWTTMPGDWTDITEIPGNDPVSGETIDVTVGETAFYEWMYGTSNTDEYKVEYTDTAGGAFEPGRNCSLLRGTKLTVLDPRYARTAPAIVDPDGDVSIFDVRDPSKFFVTFEVGDNTTVAEGEATPLDMFYSRAFRYGDAYEMIWTTSDATYDLAITDDNEGYFDWLENKKDVHAAEAAFSANPSGTFYWAIYNEWKEDAHENAYDSDATVRRLLFLDQLPDPYEEDDGGGGPPDNKPGGGGKSKITPVLFTGIEDDLIR